MTPIIATLNTTTKVPQALQDQVWKELIKAGAENCTTFRIGYETNNPILTKALQSFGDSSIGGSQEKVIAGKFSPDIVDWLINNDAREKLDWIEFYNGSERCFEHYDDGQQVSVILDIEDTDKLKKALTEQGINPDTTLFLNPHR